MDSKGRESFLSDERRRQNSGKVATMDEFERKGMNIERCSMYFADFVDRNLY